MLILLSSVLGIFWEERGRFASFNLFTFQSSCLINVLQVKCFCVVLPFVIFLLGVLRDRMSQKTECSRKKKKKDFKVHHFIQPSLPSEKSDMTIFFRKKQNDFFPAVPQLTCTSHTNLPHALEMQVSQFTYICRCACKISLQLSIYRMQRTVEMV